MEKEENIIFVQNLVKKFKDLIAVNDISFQVNKGEIFAFLGPNGAGKSTTIKMLTTLLDPTSGSILIDGHDPSIDKNIVRHSFGIVFQDPSLDDELTAYENMDLHGALYGIPNPERSKRIKVLLDFVELYDRRNEFIKNFSGGMRRRLEIARGLMHHPKILFLDEPTIGLDPQTRKKIWDYIRHINKNEGMTVFFTTHYMDEAEKVANKIAIIDNGIIVAQGTTKQLMRQTNTDSLESAYLHLTGTKIREEKGDELDRMRQSKNFRD